LPHWKLPQAVQAIAAGSGAGGSVAEAAGRGEVEVAAVAEASGGGVGLGVEELESPLHARISTRGRMSRKPRLCGSSRGKG
jgi:hypothetical protein